MMRGGPPSRYRPPGGPDLVLMVLLAVLVLAGLLWAVGLL
jgi:hypothetical protein